MRTFQIKYSIPVMGPHGAPVLTSTHRELVDLDDDHYDRRNPPRSQTELLAVTCTELDGHPTDVAERRAFFRRLDIAQRDMAFFLLLKRSDPDGVVMKEVVCPVGGETLEVPAVGDDLPDDYDPPLFDAETTIELGRPIELPAKGETATITALRVRIATGQDQEAVWPVLRKRGATAAKRALRALCLVEAIGLPLDRQNQIRNEAFIGKLSKSDQKKWERWTIENSILPGVQTAYCLDHECEISHMWDADPFF